MVADAGPASCPKCGALRRAERASGAPRRAEGASGALRRAERACSRCGLLTERMEAYARTRDAAAPEAVAAAWDRVLESWDDTGRHDALLRLVAQHDAYAWTAARYRDAKRAAPASPSPFRSYPDHAVDAIADRQLDRMRRAAEATLYASATARDQRARRPYRAATAILAMLIFAIVAGLVFAMMLQGSRSASSGQAEARPAPPAPPPGPAQPAKPNPTRAPEVR